MPVLFELVRRPDTSKVTPYVRAEIRKAFANETFPAIVADINKEISGWSGKPKFRYKVDEQGRKTTFSVFVDDSTKIGQILIWVDKGTGLEGPKKAKYPITAVNVPLMKFVVPYQPKTFPVQPLRYDPNAPPKFIQRYTLMHPGIQARGISEKIRKKYASVTERKGVFQTIRNAFTRVFRRIFKVR